MKYIVTEEIKSETQVIWWLYAQDAIFLVIWTILILFLRERVHDHFQAFYLLFSIVVGIRLVMRSEGNPKRKYYQCIALYLMQSKDVFRYYKEERGTNREDEGDKTHQRRNTYRAV